MISKYKGVYMKKRNIVLLGSGIVSIMLVIMLICIYLFKEKDVYKLDLPKYEVIEKIVFEKNELVDELNNNKYLKIIYDILNNKKRITYDKSIQDYPVNVDNIIKLDIYLKDANITSVYMYQKNNKYYLEQPYNGIYKITEDEFNNINYFIFQEKLSTDVINELKNTKTIVVNNYSSGKLIKNITDDKTISNLIDILSNAKIWNGAYNDIGLEYKLYFLDKDNLYLAEASILPDFHLTVDKEQYFLIDIDINLIRKLIEE